MAHTTTGVSHATGSDPFARIWARLSSADRYVLLGHDRDELTDAEKARLARVAGELARQVREGRGRRGRR